MEGKEVSGSYLIVSEGKSDSFYPMYFGVSCAFFALKVLTRPDKEDDRWSELCDKMLQGSAQLLGLLVWKIQRGGANGGQCELLHKLETAEKEIMELKKIRHEDAKANEKVVSIYASQEQSWLIERKKLQQHIGGLMNGLRVLEKKSEEAISELNEKLKEMELLVQSKDKAVQEEEQRRKELEEKLAKAEKIAEELRETAKREAQEHSTDLWKHKTAFLELVSNQRQLEAEMGRALRQLEAKKQELDAVLEQKESSLLLTQKLSMEVVKTRKDLEQKDKILSAMLRKSKLDTTEKQMLLKEVKLSKAKKKQAELETERWKSVSDSKHERHSLRSMFSHHANLMRSEDPPIEIGASQVVKGRSQSISYDLEYENPEFQKNWEVFSPLANFYSPEGNDELADVKRLEGWVRSQAEKYAAAIEKRHHLEIDAFAEQMRLKDEKLEAFRWRMLSMDIESKRLQSQIEGLNRDVSHLRHENMKLEALLLERQEELTGLKEQLKVQTKPQFSPMANLNSCLDDPALVHDAICSNAKNVMKEPIENDQEIKEHLMETSQEKNPEAKEEEEDEEVLHTLSKNVNKTVQSPEKEFEEEKDFSNQDRIQEESASPLVVDTTENLALTSQSSTKTNNSPWRMDLHALGVSYKIKRLKQQLLMLERLTGKQESGEHIGNNEAKNGIKGFQSLMSLLNKQVNRYQSLQAKTDELCQRMHDSDVDAIRGDTSTSTARKKGETKTLEHFLEETFQVQRYMVATGQKLMEVQSKISSGFVEVPEELEKSAGSFDMKRFADNIKPLFQEVQRGLEVRIARIIGDLEGTLACEGMIRMKRR